MKIAVLTIAYNEEEYIRACIRQFKPLHHLVLVSTRNWKGVELHNKTAIIARQEGAEVIEAYWDNETNQRNYGLARLYDYDYVLIVDADEFYTPDDIQKIKDTLGDEKCYRCPNTIYNYLLER